MVMSAQGHSSECRTHMSYKLGPLRGAHSVMALVMLVVSSAPRTISETAMVKNPGV